jgi:hypothetical protein
MSGLALAAGSRASSTSTTRSWVVIRAASSRRALVMCPGYHWSDKRPFYPAAAPASLEVELTRD